MSWLQGFRMGELISILIIVLSSMLILIGSNSLPGPEYDPLGPAGVPKYIAYLMLVLAAVNIARVVKRRGGDTPVMENSVPTNRKLEAGVTALATLAYLTALTVGGISFPVSTLVFLFVAGTAMTHFSRSKIPIILGIAVVVSYGLNYVFTDVLNVILPG